MDFLRDDFSPLAIPPEPQLSEPLSSTCRRVSVPSQLHCQPTLSVTLVRLKNYVIFGSEKRTETARQTLIEFGVEVHDDITWRIACNTSLEPNITKSPSVAALAAHHLRLLFGGGNTVMFGLSHQLGLPMANAETLQGALKLCRPVEGLQEPELEGGLLYLESFLISTQIAVVRLTGALFGDPACESLHQECAPLAGHHLVLECSNLVSLHQQGTIPLRRLAQAAWECGRQTVVVGLHRHPARVLADSGLDRYFQRQPSMEAALAALGH